MALGAHEIAVVIADYRGRAFAARLIRNCRQRVCF